jgi:hypothetical protein
MKKGPLSNAEKQYISENVESTEITVIATSLDRSVSIVQKYVDGSTPPKPAKKDAHTAKLFARNEERGVTIMTENASMASDETKAKRKEAANGVPRYQKHIHTIKQ